MDQLSETGRYQVSEKVFEKLSRVVPSSSKTGGADRAETLCRLSRVPGVYVPSLYEHTYKISDELDDIRPLGDAPARVERQWVKNLDDYPAHTVVVTDETEFNLYLIETARGCGRHCRFL